jgi:hypothetical protein
MGIGLAGSVLIFAAAAAAESPRTRPQVIPSHDSAPRLRATLLFESFETAVPPAGWTRNATAPQPFTWHASTDSSDAHEGIRSAAVDWSATTAQDERLNSPAIDLLAYETTDDIRLRFWWYGNPFFADAADFVVSASADGIAWTDLWAMSSVAENDFAWRHADLDVASYAGGNLRVRFRYVGTNGADLLLDEVEVASDEPPPPIPANDDCAGALAAGGFVLAPGPFSIDADNTDATLDYPLTMPGSCTGYTHAGRDLVWIVDLAEGESLTATMTTIADWDDTLFLVEDCANAEGTCVAGDNAIPDGSSLAYTRTQPGTGRYYLIASAYGSGAGPFHLAGAVGPGTSIARATWGRVKAAYR